MTERESMLAAVLAAPEDDTPRLIFADWLDEHGESERGEFIRVQCELWRRFRLCHPIGQMTYAAMPPGRRHEYRDLKALRRREEDLWSSGCVEWFKEAPFCVALTPESACIKPMHGFPRRGFIESITCTAADWLTHADKIMAAQPVRKVRLTTQPEWEVQWGSQGMDGETRIWLEGEYEPHLFTGKEVNDAIVPGENVIDALLRLRYHRITFELP